MIVKYYQFLTNSHLNWKHDSDQQHRDYSYEYGIIIFQFEWLYDGNKFKQLRLRTVNSGRHVSNKIGKIKIDNNQLIDLLLAMCFYAW